MLRHRLPRIGPTNAHHFRATWLMCAGVILAGATCIFDPPGPTAHAQATPPAVEPLEPIYWKQTLFLVPYQWSSAADPGAAQAVWLFVSKDGGLTWQKISEAQPHVRAFTYHAEGDGEYAFAIRTIDGQGRERPAGAYRPELRVIVDTTMPRIEELSGTLLGDGLLEIRGRATDQNLDPNSWKIEVQTEPGGVWQPVALAGGATAEVATTTPHGFGPEGGHFVWQAPAGTRPIALRATVFDLAGNSAVSQATVSAAQQSFAVSHRPSGNSSNPPNIPQMAGSAGDPAGWVSGSTATGAGAAATAESVAEAVAAQPWPAGVIARGPFRLPPVTSGTHADAVTTYGRPAGVAPSRAMVDDDAPAADPDRYAMAESRTLPSFRPLEPFRQASSVRGGDRSLEASPPWLADILSDTDARGRGFELLPSAVEPKWVGSRTFALEYELADVGHWGVSQVELWGTLDGGQSWRRFAEDPDRRSPLYVTVDDAGLYGFRIVVKAAGGPPIAVPQPGDEPELWVAVDVDRPRAELVAIQAGSGNLSDHLIMRWSAEDEHLDPRPISLFYSSRPGGPWSAIATGLENTGEYAWRLERHVPSRFYLRLEARDLAGNIGAYQTAEPVAFEPRQPAAVIHSVAPLGPTATGADSAYR